MGDEDGVVGGIEGSAEVKEDEDGEGTSESTESCHL